MPEYLPTGKIYRYQLMFELSHMSYDFRAHKIYSLSATGHYKRQGEWQNQNVRLNFAMERLDRDYFTRHGLHLASELLW